MRSRLAGSFRMVKHLSFVLEWMVLQVVLAPIDSSMNCLIPLLVAFDVVNLSNGLLGTFIASCRAPPFIRGDMFSTDIGY